MESTKRLDALGSSPFPLTAVFFGLLAAHRAACRQERTFHRLSGFAVGWLLALGRHTVPRVLAALGLVEVDWSAFYRLFARDRLAYDALCRTLLRQTLALAPADGPYLVAVDGTAIPRRSRTMPGTGWLRAAGTAPFNRGLARCQRFVDLCWLPRPSPDGSSRALPLRWLPAFTPKAVPAAGSPPCPEWAAGLAALGWVRRELDALGRAAQRLVAVADGTDATVELWKRLPAGVVLLARCAKNRALFALPTPPGPGQKGRTRRYGAQARHPGGWLAERGGWRRAVLAVRGRTLRPRYRVEGPYRLKRAAAHPVFLLVVKGVDRPGRRGRRVRREPTDWLVSAEATPDGGWALPVPAATLLAWAWRRWEGEVAHREQKTAFGLGDPRCWGRRSTVTSGPFAGWLYGLLVLTGLTVWGLGRPPPPCPRPGGGGAAAGGARTGSGRRGGPSCGISGIFGPCGAGRRATGPKWPTGRPPSPTRSAPPATPDPVRAGSTTPSCPQRAKLQARDSKSRANRRKSLRDYERGFAIGLHVVSRLEPTSDR